MSISPRKPQRLGRVSEWKWRGTHVKRVGIIENSRFTRVEEDLNGDTAVPNSAADGRWGLAEAHGILTGGEL